MDVNMDRIRQNANVDKGKKQSDNSLNGNVKKKKLDTRTVKKKKRSRKVRKLIGKRKLNTSAKKEEKGMIRRINAEVVQEVSTQSSLKLETLLKYAAIAGDFETIVALHEKGVSIETEKLKQKFCDHFGFYATPLHIAAAHGHAKCVDILIALGANVDAQAYLGTTPLHLAVQKNHYQCTKLLLKAGADCNLRINLDSKETAFPGFSTPLHLATKNNNVNLVRYLIKYGANCEAVDANGHTSLYIAAKQGFLKCVLMHLEHAPNPDYLSTPCYEFSNTPLHYLVRNGTLGCVRKLVQLGADVNHLNNKGYSPIHMLFINPSVESDLRMELLKVLVKEGHNVNMKISLHHIMFFQWYPEAIIFLIGYGADINVVKEWYGSNLSYLFSFMCSKRLNSEFLKCIVNWMPVLPRLNMLSNIAGSKSFHESKILRDTLPPGILILGLVQHNNNPYVKIRNTGRSVSMVLTGVKGDDDLNETRYIPLEQPFLDQIYEFIKNEVRVLNVLQKSVPIVHSGRFTTSNLYLDDIYRKLLLQLWYEKMAMNPRSLQHCCRFAIRQSMGTTNLKRIKKLSLPPKLISYLLFEYDD